MRPADFLAKQVEESIALKRDFFANHRDRILLLGRKLKGIRDQGGKVLIFGNGGSASDAQHFAAELMHKVEQKPLGVRAIALHTDTSLITAIGNDEEFANIYARQIEILAEPGDLAIAISTSGNSSNIVEALKVARRMKCDTVGFLGRNGGSAIELCDLSLVVSHQSTPRIQEVHGMLIHLVCQLLELELESEGDPGNAVAIE